MNRKIIRCAIYTRKSSEEGLEQDFNSLDAQREAGEAYIKSQRHEGWELITTKYDDGGYSGGNMDRPALKNLLFDISAGKIDVVVVYKVDRLSRALSDFAKIVDVFDKQSVSFVSVTQQFNTTTSMGRLTLNMLLSFAQFEREVTGERIRDKVAASKKKGMWMGGPLSIGYDVIDRKLIINEYEAEIVRFIYTRFLELNGAPLKTLLQELKQKDYRNKSWISKVGNNIVGKDFTLNQISQILRKPIYIGKIKHKDKIYDGEHKAIISQEIWDQVQERLVKTAFVKNPVANSERPKLAGKIYDYLGNKLSPTYSYKYYDGKKYKMKYYVNREICKTGKTDSQFKRIRADNIDSVVENELLKIINARISEVTASKNPELISASLKQLHELKNEPFKDLTKAILFPDHIELHLNIESISKVNITVKYKKLSGKLYIIRDGEESETDVKKQFLYPEDKAFTLITKSFYWNKQINDGMRNSPLMISKTQNHDLKYVKRAMRQRFLSPKIIEKIISPDNTLSEKPILADQLIRYTHWCWADQEKTFLNL